MIRQNNLEVVDVNKIKFGNARKFKGIEKDGERTCTKCMRSKLLCRFNRSAAHYGGIYPWCISCQSNNAKCHYAKRTERTLEEVGSKGRVVDGNKKCGTCKELKPIKDFYENKNYKSGLTSQCKKCINNASRSFSYKESKRVRLICMMGYGGCCQCCGERNVELLTLEHIRGKGFKHIRESNIIATMKKLIELGFPEGHTCLCMNCNFYTRFGVPCIHSAEHKKYIDKYINPYYYEKQKELDELERQWAEMNID